MGRSKWPQVAEAIEDGRIEKWLAKGIFEKDIAKNLGVHVSTWEEYKLKKPELREAIKKGNRPIVQEVQDALIRRALGYDYTETKVYQKENANGEVITHTESHTKHMPADVGAACFILKNKDSAHWKNDPSLTAVREKELELRKQIASGRGDLWD